VNKQRQRRMQLISISTMINRLLCEDFSKLNQWNPKGLVEEVA